MKTLLIHSCCAPCSSSVIEQLKEKFDITILYYNPNIYPESEYQKRLTEQRNYLKKIGIKLIEETYNPEEYLEAIKGKETLGEKTLRCFECYKFRMKKTAEIAQKLHFDYFTTTLSVSPHKNADYINQIGNELSTENCQFLVSNFKKNNGYLRSIQLSKENNFYRQQYCGCEMSYRCYLNKLEKKITLWYINTYWKI